MNVEYLLSAFLIGQIKEDLFIESALANEGLVKLVWHVGGSKDDDSRVTVEAVHLREKLIYRLLCQRATSLGTSFTTN